jgi:hypothetical protein
MGLSGWLPGYCDERWDSKFGGIPTEVWGEVTYCPATNLKKNPVKFKFYPPVKCPSQNETLTFRIVH